MRIAVCDDEINVSSQIENFIFDYAEREGISAETEVFNRGAELIDRIKSGCVYDIIFLDIRLPDSLGSDVGNIIRESLEDNSVSIVYISSYTEYALSLFKSRPLDFLIKPVTYEKTADIFSRFEKLRKVDKEVFTYKKGKNFKQVLLKDIMYFSREGKKLVIHTAKGDDSCYIRLEELNLGDSFVRVHKSFIVNKHYITEYKYDEFILSDGSHVPISRVYRKDIHKMINSML